MFRLSSVFSFDLSNKLFPFSHQLLMVLRCWQILQELDRVLAESLLYMGLAGADPFLHAPARKDLVHVITCLVFFERGWRGYKALARTYFVNLFKSHVGVVELESVRKA